MNSDFEVDLARNWHQWRNAKGKHADVQGEGQLPEKMELRAVEFAFEKFLVTAKLWRKPKSDMQAVYAVATTSSLLHLYPVQKNTGFVGDNCCLKLKAPNSTFSTCDIDLHLDFDSFGTDSARIVTACSDGALRFWKASNFHLLPEHSDMQIESFDNQQNENPAVLQTHTGKVAKASYIPHSTGCVSIGTDTKVVISDVQTLKHVTHYTAHSQPLSALSMHPLSPVIAVGEESGMIAVWDLRCRKYICDFNRDLQKEVYGPNAISRTTIKDKHESKVTSLAWDNTGTLLVSGSEDTFAKVWDLRKQALIKTIAGHTDRICKVAFWNGRSENILSASIDGDFRIWDWYNQAVARSFPTGRQRLTSVEINVQNSTIYSTYFDKVLNIYHYA